MTRTKPGDHTVKATTTRITIPLTDDMYRRLLAEQQRRGEGKPFKPSFASMAYADWLDKIPKLSKGKNVDGIARHRKKMRKRRRNGQHPNSGGDQTQQDQ